MRHPTPVDIEEHVRTRRETAVSAHLQNCGDCAKMARSIEAFGDPLTWEIASMPDGALGDADALSFGTRRVLQRLEQAEHFRNLDPAEGVEICDELLTTPECSIDSEEGRHLTVLVLRERANALRFLGDLPGALATIKRARSLADELFVGEYENAVLDFIEAAVLYEQDDLDPIAAIAQKAISGLTRFGDEARARNVRFLAAAVEYKRGAYASARSLFLDILDSMDWGEQPAIVAGLLNNLANCEIPLREFDDAKRHIEQAATIFGELEMTTELIRLSWLDARMAVAKGETARGERLYIDTESRFADAGLKFDAALVGLELVELYDRQERRDLVVETASRLAAVFAEAGARMSLATTLATLREAAIRGDDVTDSVSAARTSIEELMAAGA